MSAPHGRRVAWATTTASTMPAAQPAGPPTSMTQASDDRADEGQEGAQHQHGEREAQAEDDGVGSGTHGVISHPLHRQHAAKPQPPGCWIALAAQPEVLVGLEDEEVALPRRSGAPVGHARPRRSSARPRSRDHGAVDRLALGGEVGEQQQALAGLLAQQAEDVVVAGPQRLGARPARGPRACARRAATSRRSPSHRRPSTVRRVVRGARPPPSPSAAGASSGCRRACAGSAGPARVVAQAELVAHVDQRQPAVGEGDARRAAGCGAARAPPPARRRARAPPRGRPARPPCRSCAPRRCAGRAGSARRARTSPGSRPRRSRPGSAGAGARPRPTAPASSSRDRPADVVVAAHVGHPAGAGRHRRHRPQRAASAAPRARRPARSSSSTMSTLW